MDTRAPQGFVPLAAAATEPRAKRGSAATELPKPKTVDSSNRAETASNERLAEDETRRARQKETADALRAQSEVDIKTHEATGSIVIQTRDSSTGEIVHQFPDNATLKQRAMARYEAVQGSATIKRLA